MREPAGVQAPRTTVVLIVGAGRSGTTLLGNTLGSLPGALSAGEVKLALGRGVAEAGTCGCRRPVVGCPVWAGALEATFGRIPSVPVARAFDRRLDALVRTRHLGAWLAGRQDRVEVTEFVDVLGRLMGHLAEAAEVTTIVDSSKNPAYGALLALSPLLDVRTVHVMRDPHAVAWSWQRRAASQQVGGFEEEMERFSSPRSALIWMSANAAAELLPGARRQPTVRVRYEDFVADPTGTVRTVADFAGLEPDLSFISADGLRLGPSHAVAGNPNRVRTGPIRLSSDDEWRRSLPAAGRRTVSLMTLPQRVRYGY